MLKFCSFFLSSAFLPATSISRRAELLPFNSRQMGASLSMASVVVVVAAATSGPVTAAQQEAETSGGNGALEQKRPPFVRTMLVLMLMLLHGPCIAAISSSRPQLPLIRATIKKGNDQGTTTEAAAAAAGEAHMSIFCVASFFLGLPFHFLLKVRDSHFFLALFVSIFSSCLLASN